MLTSWSLKLPADPYKIAAVCYILCMHMYVQYISQGIFKVFHFQLYIFREMISLRCYIMTLGFTVYHCCLTCSLTPCYCSIRQTPLLMWVVDTTHFCTSMHIYMLQLAYWRLIEMRKIQVFVFFIWVTRMMSPCVSSSAEIPETSSSTNIKSRPLVSCPQ